MRQLEGNFILLVDSDPGFDQGLASYMKGLGVNVVIATDIRKAMEQAKNFSFDLVLCNYYLPDGLIYNLIDWCKTQMEILPVFMSIGSAFPADEQILRRHCISGSVKRGDFSSLLKKISPLLFNRMAFKKTQDAFSLEIISGEKVLPAQLVELTKSGMTVSLNDKDPSLFFSLARVTYEEGDEVKTHLFPCQLSDRGVLGCTFEIYEPYRASWTRLVQTLQTASFERAAGY